MFATMITNNDKIEEARTKRMRAFNKTIWLYSLLFGAEGREQYIRAGRRYVDFLVGHIEKHHGRKMAAKMGKLLFGAAKRAAFGYQDEPVMYPIWTKCLDRNIPIKLQRLRRLLLGSKPDRLFALSVFALYLSYRLRPEWDFSTIEDSYTGKATPTSFYAFVKNQFVPWIRSLHPTKVRIPKDLFLVKKGAYPCPSVITAAEDAFTWLRAFTVGSPWAIAVESLVRWFGGKDFGERWRTRVERLSVFSRFDREIGRKYAHNVLSRFSWFPPRAMRTTAIQDRGGKTRMVTSGSYWIQFALYPIHDLFMKILRKIPEDYTYKQSEALGALRRWHRMGCPVFSYDLTAATDRFPLDPQWFVLKTILGAKVANAWWAIMRCPCYVNDYIQRLLLERNFVQFHTGQPMGLYSSWPVFTLTHHAVVRYCFWMEGIDPERRYAILGDDVTIAHHLVAKRYHSLITETLGVDISLPKSYIPDLGLGINPGEFAKQLISHGRCFTPITPDLMLDIQRHNWVNILPLLKFYRDCWRFDIDRVNAALPRFIRAVIKRPQDRAKALRFLAYKSPQLLSKPDWLALASKRFDYNNQPWIWDPPLADGPFMQEFRTTEAKLLKERLLKKLDSYVQYPMMIRSALPIIEDCPDDRELFLRMDRYVPYFDEPIARLAVRAIWKLNQADSWDNIQTAEIHATMLDGLMEREFTNFWLDPVTIKSRASARQAIRWAKLDAHCRKAIESRKNEPTFWPPPEGETPDSWLGSYHAFFRKAKRKGVNHSVLPQEQKFPLLTE